MSELLDRLPIAHGLISVILLAGNEDSGLAESIRDWTLTLEDLARDHEVLLLCDGSTDCADEFFIELVEQNPRLRVLQPVNARGIGACIRVGLSAARHPLICYAECSKRYQPADLAKLLKMIDQVELVSGYRVSQEAEESRSWNGLVFRWMIRLMFGVRLKDADCAFKLFRREIFARIPIQSDGSFVHVEILAKANFLGCLIGEVPVSYRPRSQRISRRAEAWRLFFHPDFGPAILPSAAESSVEPQSLGGEVSVSKGGLDL